MIRSPEGSWSYMGLGVLLTLALVTNPALEAQERDYVDSLSASAGVDPDSAQSTAFADLLIPASLGALAGSAGGLFLGAMVGLRHSGEWAGVQDALIGGMLGGALGSATGVWLSDRTRAQMSYRSSFISGGLGIVGGVGALWAFTTIAGPHRAGLGQVYLVYAIGQGVFTAAVAPLLSGQ